MKENRIDDAFGRALLDCQTGRADTLGGAVPYYVERDDDFIQAGDLRLYFSEFENWPSIEKILPEVAQGRVLDIGCGAGRHAIFLQNQGLDVLGIDASRGAVSVCRMRGLRKAMNTPIENLGYLIPRSFETVVMFGHNFGLLGDPQKAKNILWVLYGLTSLNAKIIATSRDPYRTKDLIHLGYHEINRRKGRLAGQLKLRIRYKNLIGPWFDYLFVSKKEMENLLKKTGWEIARTVFDENEVSYSVVLTKAGR